MVIVRGVIQSPIPNMLILPRSIFVLFFPKLIISIILLLPQRRRVFQLLVNTEERQSKTQIILMFVGKQHFQFSTHIHHFCHTDNISPEVDSWTLKIKHYFVIQTYFYIFHLKRRVTLTPIGYIRMSIFSIYNNIQFFI